ncbi:MULTISPECIES: DUF6705 family protein [Chryseobacterium]|uniref:DUF6705 domain-containing protein n=2 Tax=Chryseobacterium TaxID=59732 RepID=A0ABU0TK97_9FLAO|nr:MULTISPECIES: DUF6705 family protein [Chryseobacterium]MDQ1097465.1 hypothetical protein [Chryseobacterium camelliae]MDQ1101394.1 hypothetical protein [Chryseobacterium sp. SORGH_AS_1048]MDR6084838.1 hypothetical protein [Chryseobacterium sp. SORGH_AS_0909]MDT3408681.1 hypothetical protein [Pseudacidovorax intermedius]
MKNIILIILSIITFSCNAQIYPLNTSPGDIPDNAYIKDINNELDQYVGLWKGTWEGKTLYLELKKVKTSSISGSTHPYYKDRILGERKVIASNGTVEIDRITNFDTQSPEFSGISKSLKNGNWKRITFYPKDMCKKMATLDITNFTGSQMTLHLEYLPSFVDSNCQHNAYVNQYGDFPINFPKDIVLTKQ